MRPPGACNGFLRSTQVLPRPRGQHQAGAAYRKFGHGGTVSGAHATVNTAKAKGNSRRNFEMVRVIEKGSYEFAFNHPTASIPGLSKTSAMHRPARCDLVGCFEGDLIPDISHALPMGKLTASLHEEIYACCICTMLQETPLQFSCERHKKSR
jgi:hypothetical protein